ncbi:hypothetical protein B7494_g6191 [Chlorociboria aeruginascens]|nr:hypothetical protein B7494_g6191 [Chlorociboria aeruginascens]
MSQLTATVTSAIWIYEVCALPGPNTTSCSNSYQTITTTSPCSTVLTAFYQSVTVTECDQNITFSSQSSWVLASTSTSSPSSTPTTYIESVVSYYVAPWQSLAARNSSAITVNVCSTDFVGIITCTQIQEVWIVQTESKPVISTTTLSISTSFSSSVVLFYGQTESLTASSGAFSLSTEIMHTSWLTTYLTSTSTLLTSSNFDEDTSTSTATTTSSTATTTTTSTVTVTIASTITKTLRYASTTRTSNLSAPPTASSANALASMTKECLEHDDCPLQHSKLRIRIGLLGCIIPKAIEERYARILRLNNRATISTPFEEFQKNVIASFLRAATRVSELLKWADGDITAIYGAKSDRHVLNLALMDMRIALTEFQLVSEEANFPVDTVTEYLREVLGFTLILLELGMPPGSDWFAYYKQSYNATGLQDFIFDKPNQRVPSPGFIPQLADAIPPRAFPYYTLGSFLPENPTFPLVYSEDHIYGPLVFRNGLLSRSDDDLETLQAADDGLSLQEHNTYPDQVPFPSAQNIPHDLDQASFPRAGFFAISSIITRRSLVKRYRTTVPKFYHPSNRPNGEINGALDAVDALSIATMNVCSIGIMLSGGLLWAFDISTLNDMRAKVRPRIGVDINRSDQDVEEEIEEWFATVLARKEFKHLHSQALEERAKNEVKK